MCGLVVAFSIDKNLNKLIYVANKESDVVAILFAKDTFESLNFDVEVETLLRLFLCPIR